MKPSMLFLPLLAVLFSATTVFGQNALENVSILNADKLKVVKLDEQNKVVTLEGGVKIKTELLSVLDAKMVQIDQKKNRITVFGEAAYEFSGRLIVLPANSSKDRRLEYTIGEQVAYIR